MPRSVNVALTDATLVGDARRIATDLARKAGLNEAEEARVGLIVTEAATNAVRHGQNARILLRTLNEHVGRGIEVLALDSGRGMSDVARCLEDGYSTGGTAGNGLGAIKRLSDLFDIYSQMNLGTIVLARVFSKPDLLAGPRVEFGCVCVPKPLEEACGDVWAFQIRRESELFTVADGLGHGPMAALAADEAARVFDADRKGHPRDILEAAHGPLRATRGASMAVAELCFDQRVLRYAGVGNISGRILVNDTSRSLISHDGTVGHELHRIQEFNYPWPEGGMLVLHSDGLLTRWDLAGYRGLAVRHPALIAGVLYRDFLRGRDDVTVLVARERA